MMTGEMTEESDDEEEKKVSMRSHEREDKMTGAVDKLNAKVRKP